VFVDRKGYVWFGATPFGLTRYCPKTGRFKHYCHKQDDLNSLSFDDVSAIHEDKNGLFWIGTPGGLDLLDREKEIFTHFRHDPENPNTLSSDNILDIAEDPDSEGSVLWIGTSNGLNRLDYEQNKFTCYQHDPENQNSLSHNFVRALLVSHSGELWIATRNGLDHFNPATRKFVHYRHDPEDPNSLSHSAVFSLIEDRSGNLWLGMGDGALSRLISGSPGSNESNFKESFPTSRADSTRVAARFIHYKHDPANPYSLSNSSRILDIYEDDSGAIWIAHRRGGIDKFDRFTARFTNYRKISGNSNSLNHNTVFDIYQAPDGILWVATQGGGLNRIDRQRGNYIHYVIDPDNPYSLKSNFLNRIYPDPDSIDILWIGTISGLYRFTVPEERFVRYTSGQNVFDIEKDRYGNIWFGTRGKGIYRYGLSSRTLTNYRHDPSDDNSLSEDFVSDIHFDPSEMDTVLWIATENGLNRFDTQKERIRRYKYDPTDSSSLSHNIATSIFEDEDSELWISTYSAIDKIDRENEAFTRFIPTTHEAPPLFYTMAADNNGILWICAVNGLWSFNPDSRTFKRYTVDDGLPGNTFFSWPYFNKETGELFAGGQNGFTSFYPEQMEENPYIPPIVLTSFKIFNQEVKLDRSLSYVDEITLSYNKNVFSFEFAALNYINPGENQYSYKMEGFDQNW
jgi:ligand-binding sensor domain-containing protein